MRKILVVLSLFLVLLSTKSFSQVTLTIGNANNVDPGTNVNIDVTVAGFTNIVSAQYSLNYDSTVLDFVNVTNIFTALDGLGAQNIVGPNGAGVKNGQITFSWNDPAVAGKSVPLNTRLFTIVFRAKGAACSTSDIVTSDKPTEIEIVNGMLDVVPLVSIKGSVKLKCGPGNTDPCPDPACSNAANLQIEGAKVTGMQNAIVCVPFTVRNFRNMQSGQGQFKWNPNHLRFAGHKVDPNGPFKAAEFAFNQNDTLAGKYKVLWTNDTPGTPRTVADGTKLIELCFRVLIPAPDTTCVTYEADGTTFPIEWIAESGEVQTCIKNGRVFLGSAPPPADGPTIKINDASGQKDQIVCVDVTVEDFNGVVGLAADFKWNPAELEFVRTDMYMLEALIVSNFNAIQNTGTMKFSWTSQIPISRADGSKIFQICFKVLGPCPGSANITFGAQIQNQAVVLNNNTPVELPLVTIGGKITCGDNPCATVTCTQGAVTNVACNGQTNGSAAITVTVTSGNATSAQCQWKSNGAVIQGPSALANGCNLNNVGAGTYTYEVICTVNNSVLCSGTVTISEPAIINIPTVGVVTNAACGQKGSINISLTSGGTPPYTYNWNPNLGNTNNPINLDPGTYLVTVTDSRGCTDSESFTITNQVQPLNPGTPQVTNVRCAGDKTGSIVLAPSGGCMPYSFFISGGISLTNLGAGSYSITVTDALGTSATTTATITEPTAIVIGAPVVVKSVNGLNGSITVAISGGTPNYTTTWSGGIPTGTTSGTISANNLIPGTYNLTVTDANGCTRVLNGIVVENTVINEDTEPQVNTFTIGNSTNGFGVACNGDATGSVVINFGGTLPITLTLKSNGNPVGTPQVINSGNTYTFTGLKAGSYTVELKNTKGTINTPTPVVITQPTRLILTSDVDCTEKDGTTGSVTVDPGVTGVGPYTYVWANQTVTGASLTNVGRGLYNVTVTDANGCTVSLSNLEVKNCSFMDTTSTCFVASKIITPNGDNFNDLFLINCVDVNDTDLTVYDRYGRQVYFQPNYDNTWQGTESSGRDLEEGGYIWVLTHNIGQGRREVYKGTVTILRTR
jgi:gliding motility-associated-like protein